MKDKIKKVVPFILAVLYEYEELSNEIILDFQSFIVIIKFKQ